MEACCCLAIQPNSVESRTSVSIRIGFCWAFAPTTLMSGFLSIVPSSSAMRLWHGYCSRDLFAFDCHVCCRLHRGAERTPWPRCSSGSLGRLFARSAHSTRAALDPSSVPIIIIIIIIIITIIIIIIIISIIIVIIAIVIIMVITT